MQEQIRAEILNERDETVLHTKTEKLIEYYISAKQLQPIEFDPENQPFLDHKKELRQVPASQREGPYRAMGDLSFEFESIVLTIPIRSNSDKTFPIIATVLLENAIKYCVPQTEIFVRVKQLSPDQCEVAVNNIAPHVDVLPDIFEKGIRVNNDGTGMGLQVVSYTFEPSLKSVPKKTWYAKDGTKMTGGGYTRRLKRHRTAVRSATLNLATDFVPKERYWWQGEGFAVPDAKLFIDKNLR